MWTVCLRPLPDSVAAAIWTQALLRLSPARQPLGYRATRKHGRSGESTEEDYVIGTGRDESVTGTRLSERNRKLIPAVGLQRTTLPRSKKARQFRQLSITNWRFSVVNGSSMFRPNPPKSWRKSWISHSVPLREVSLLTTVDSSVRQVEVTFNVLNMESDSYLKWLKLQRHRVAFRHRDFPDAFLVGFVVVRVVRTGQNARLLADFSATHR